MIWVFIGILIGTYILIISQKIPHSLAALLGALSVVFAGAYFGLFDFFEALTFIDLEIITLIIGLFILIEIVSESGLFQFMAIKILKKTGGKPIPLFLAFISITFFITGIVSNITGILIIGVLTIVTCEIFDYNPIPFIIGEVFVSNAGGIALVSGAIPIVISSSVFQINFIEWAIIGYPLALVLLIVTILIMTKLKKKELQPTSDEHISVKEKLETLDEWSIVQSKKSFYVSAGVLTSVVIMFFLSSFIGLTLDFVAMLGAIIILALSDISPKEVFHNVDWGTIFFFIGLFITIGGIEKAGVLDLLGEVFTSMVGGNAIIAVVLIIFIAGLMSAVVDNVPITLTFIPVIQSLASTIPILPLVYALAIGSELGGNILPIGSPSGLVAVGLARKNGRNIGFGEYAKIGVPITLVYLMIATIYILLVGGLIF